jgi:hypothetical protein
VHPEKKIAADLAVTLKIIKAYEETVVAKAKLEGSTLFTSPAALVRERTIPTEQPPLAGEASANFCG